MHREFEVLVSFRVAAAPRAALLHLGNTPSRDGIGDWGTAGLVARQDGQVARATHYGVQKNANGAGLLPSLAA